MVHMAVVAPDSEWASDRDPDMDPMEVVQASELELDKVMVMEATHTAVDQDLDLELDKDLDMDDDKQQSILFGQPGHQLSNHPTLINVKTGHCCY